MVNKGIFIYQRYTAFEKSSKWDLRFAQTTVLATKRHAVWQTVLNMDRSTFLQNMMSVFKTKWRHPQHDHNFHRQTVILDFTIPRKRLNRNYIWE